MTRDQRLETEKRFIDELISNALVKFEQCRTLPVGQKDTIARLAKHRINIVATKLEKLLSKKTLEMHSYSTKGQVMSSMHKTKFIEEILFLLGIVVEITKSYAATTVKANRTNTNSELLSKHTCSQLISTVGGVVYFQSQFQESSNSRRLNAACGEIILVISEINEECTLFHMSQILKQCIEPNAEVRGSFYNLQTLQYIRLKTEGMLVLFSLLSNVIDQPTNAISPNFGNWKKSAMLEISAPLRVCILKWLEFDPSAMTSLLISPSSDEDNSSMLALYNKFEPWANGAKRKSAVWPLMCLLLALMPRTFFSATNDHRKKSTSTSRVLRKTVDNLNVSAMRSVLQKDSVLNTELSVISIVLMFKVAASLQRSLCYSAPSRFADTSNTSLQAHSGNASENYAQELPNKHMDELRHYLMPTVDRVRDLLFAGHQPSHIYYNAITEKTYPCMVTRGTDERDRHDHGTLCFECEHSQEYLLNTFLWSLFYVDQPRYLQLMTHIHAFSSSSSGSSSGKEAPVSSFARAHSIRSLNSILVSDGVDRVGRASTWRSPEAAVVRVLVLSILKNHVGLCLQVQGVSDQERALLSPNEQRGAKEYIDHGGRTSRKWAGGESRDKDNNKQDADEILREVLTICIENPWFVYVRPLGEDKESTLRCLREGIISSPFMAELTLLLRDITSVIRLSEDDTLSLRAEEAFFTLLDVKYIALWNPHDPFVGVMTMQAVILKHLSYQLLQCQATEGQVTYRLLTCVHCLLKNVNLYLEEDQLLHDVSFSTETLHQFNYCVIHQSLWLTEAALLLHLCSSDMDIIRQVMLCMEAWCRHTGFVSRIEVPDEMDNVTMVDEDEVEDEESGDNRHGYNDSNDDQEEDEEDHTLLFTLERDWKPYYLIIKSPECAEILLIYGELSSTVGNILSQKLQQKSIRAFLRNMPARTLGMNWALAAVLKRWETFNEEIIFRTTNSSIPDSEIAAFDEWTNYTGFLCTMGCGLFTSISPCSIDSLAPYLGGVDYECDRTRSRGTTTSSLASAGAEGCKSATGLAGSTGTKLIKQMLYLILIQHTEKRVSFDVFFAIGLSLSHPLLHHLFRELYIILDVMTDVLTKRCDNCTTNPLSSTTTSSKNRSKSPSVGGKNKDSHTSFIQNFTDFDIYIAEMPLMSVNNFINAILTMLQMIFDREWKKPDRDGGSSLSGKTKSSNIVADVTRGSFREMNIYISGNQLICLIEKLFQKMIFLEAKMHRQLEISDSNSNNSLTSTLASNALPANNNYNNVVAARTKDNYILEQFRLRKKMAFMIETFVLQMTPLCKIGATLHMRLLSILTDWVYDCIVYLASTTHTQSTKKMTGSHGHERLTKTRSMSNLVDSKENISLYQSTQLASMKAITALLKGFELIAVTDGGGGEEDMVSPAPTGPSINKSVSNTHQQKATEFSIISKAFYREFHVLHKLLGACLNSTDEISLITRGVTIHALCNLLHANTSIGLKHMIEAVNSSEDQRIRGALLSVFTETLSRRVDFNFGDDDKPIEESYEDSLQELLLLVVAPDREVIRLLSVITRSGKDATLMAAALLKLFQTLSPSVSPTETPSPHHSSSPTSCVPSSEKPEVQLLEWAIRFELSQTARLGSLFRSESMSTKLIGKYFSSQGGSYLRNTLRSPIQLFLTEAPCVEIDPHKGVREEDLADNTSRLLYYTGLFLDTIVASVSLCPQEMRHILFVLREEATLRFSGLETAFECERVSIAGYMFLRFFCPAIAMPTKFELVHSPPTSSSSSSNLKGDNTPTKSSVNAQPVLSRQASRGLLLIAKTLQNLANGTHFFEESMASLNIWIDEHLEAITGFTSAIAALDSRSGRRRRSSGENENVGGGSGAELGSHTDDRSNNSGLVSGGGITSTSSTTSAAAGIGDTPNTGINEIQIEVLTTIHTFMYYNNERLERCLFPQPKVTPTEEQLETPISPGLLPRQASINKSSSHSTDLTSLSLEAAAVPGLGVNDTCSDFMNIRDPLSALLHKLGEPPENNADSAAVNTLDGSSPRLGQTGDKNDSACSAFMSDFEARSDYLELIQSVRESMIFYSAHLSSNPTHTSPAHEIFFFIARRVTSETDPAALIYLILVELQRFVDFVQQEKDKDKNLPGPVFDLVIDSSSFNTDSELPMWSYAVFWGKLKSLIGHAFGKYFKKVYVLYPSVVLLMSTQKILKKWGLKTKTVMERVEVCTPTQLVAKYSLLQDHIPHSTSNIETTSLKHWPALFQDQQVMITISSNLLLVQSKEKIGGLEFTRTDMLFLYLIESIFKSSNGSSVKSKKHGSSGGGGGGGSGDRMSKKKFALPSKGGLSVGNDKKDYHHSEKEKTQPLVVISYTAFHSKRTLKLQFAHTTQFVSALSIALTQVRQQRALEAASESAGTDQSLLSPEAIPGILLHAAMLNLFSDLLATRKASFLLLCQLKQTYGIPLLTLPGGCSELSALFMPSNLVHYGVAISSAIATARPEYGYEFIMECFQAMKRPVNSQLQKISLVLCVAPWLPYLGLYLDCVRERAAFEVAEGRSGSSATSDDPPPPTALSSFPLENVGATNTFPTPRTPVMKANAPTISVTGVSSAFKGGAHQQHIKERKLSLTTPLAEEGRRGEGLDASHRMHLKYDFLGSRITHAKSEHIVRDLENILEIVIGTSSEDQAIATVFLLHFWEQISILPEVSMLAVNYFIKRLSVEALLLCVPSAVDSDALGGTSTGGTVSGKGSGRSKLMHDKALEFGGDVEGNALLVAPFLMHDFGCGLQATGGGISFSGGRGVGSKGGGMGSKREKSVFFDMQGGSRMCVTICEAVAILGGSKAQLQLQDHHQHLHDQQQLQQQQKKQPVTLCKLLIDHIKQLVEAIFLEEHQHDVSNTGNSHSAVPTPPLPGDPSHSTAIKFNIDINDTYMQVPTRDKSHSISLPRTSVASNTEGEDPFSRFSMHSQSQTEDLRPPHLNPSRSLDQHSVNAQLFAGEDSDEDTSIGKQKDEDEQSTEHSSSSSTSPDKNLRRNLDSFFTLPVPYSPSTTPQKVKHVSEIENPPSTHLSTNNTASTFVPASATQGQKHPSSLSSSTLSKRLKHANSKWIEVTALLRPILYLLYHNAMVLEHCTSDLLHLSLQLLAKGPRSLRPGVFTLICSLVYALLSASADEYDMPTTKFSNRAGAVTSAVGGDGRMEMHSLKSNIFSGATASVWKDLVLQLDTPSFHQIFNKTPELSSSNFELVTSLITNVVKCPASDLSARWKQALWDLSFQSSSKRFTHTVRVLLPSQENNAGYVMVHADCPVYPSYFYLLGNLIDQEKANGAYFEQIFTSFRDVIKLCSEYNFVGDDNQGLQDDIHGSLDNIEDKMLRPIFFCLSRSLKFLDLLELQRLFWCAILLLQYFPEHYLSGPVLLLHEVIDELLLLSTSSSSESSSCTDCGNGNITSSLLMMWQSDVCLRHIFEELEFSSLFGISFESSFSTALTSTLLRIFNAKDTKTKSLTIDILQKLLKHDQATFEGSNVTRPGSGVDTGVSGYSPVLLPHLGLEESVVSRPLQSISMSNSGGGDGVGDDVLFEDGGAATPNLVSDVNVTTSTMSVKAKNPDSPRASMSNQVPTYLAALSPSSIAQQGVSPLFFGVHNFPNEKSIVLFVTSLLGYLRLLAQSVYSDEEQQSHSFAFIILLQVLREVPLALNKLYQVIFAELNTTYTVSVQRNHYLADIVLEAIHECLLSKPRLAVTRGAMLESPTDVDQDNVHDEHEQESEDRTEEEEEDFLVKRKNLTIKLKPSGEIEPPSDTSFVGKIKSSILVLEKDNKEKNNRSSRSGTQHVGCVNVMREDVDFMSDDDDEEEDHDEDAKCSPHASLQKETSDMACLAEIGFPALLCGPYSYNFTKCATCQNSLYWTAAATETACPCYKERQHKKNLLSKSVGKIVESLIQSLKPDSNDK